MSGRVFNNVLYRPILILKIYRAYKYKTSGMRVWQCGLTMNILHFLQGIFKIISFTFHLPYGTIRDFASRNIKVSSLLMNFRHLLVTKYVLPFFAILGHLAPGNVKILSLSLNLLDRFIARCITEVTKSINVL